MNVVSWLYQQGAHDPTSGTQFYVNSAVLNPQSEEDETHAVIAVWEPLTGNAGAEIEFLVIDSFHHESPNILADSDLSIPWRVGDRIEDTPGFFDCSTGTHCLDCGDGYIYQGPKQDAGDLFYDTDIYGTDRQLHAGPIFPVNEGMLEVWWYEQKKGICWAYKAKRYDSTWDETVRISGASTDCTECEAEDTTVTQDFSGAGGPSFTLNGTAVLEAGAVLLTSATQNQRGSLIFEPVFPEPVIRFSIDFDYLIGGGNNGADGLSFALMDASRHSSTSLFGEFGPGAGSLEFSLDTYLTTPANGNHLYIRYNGNDLLAQEIPTSELLLDDNVWHHVHATFDGVTLSITLSRTNTDQTLSYSVDVPNFTPFSSRFGFGARTGGATNNHWVDNIVYVDQSHGTPVENSIDGDMTTAWTSGGALPSQAIWSLERADNIGGLTLQMPDDVDMQMLEFSLDYTIDSSPDTDSTWFPITNDLQMINLVDFEGQNLAISDNTISLATGGESTYSIGFAPVRATGIRLSVLREGASPFMLSEVSLSRNLWIATQNLYPAQYTSDHVNLAIYAQEDPTASGYKPNIEHGLLLPFNNTTGLYALWDFDPDVAAPDEPSVPFVLTKFQLDGTWFMDTFQVFRGDLTYRGRAGAFVAPPYPLNAETGECRPSYLYDISGAWVDPDLGIWLARGPDVHDPEETQNGYATVKIGYYENWEGDCGPWLVPDADPEGVPFGVDYESTWPEFTQPECEPGTPNCYTTLHVGESVLRPGFSSAQVVYNDAGITLIDESKDTPVPLFRLPQDLLPTFPDLRHDIRERLSYDNSLGELKYKGIMTKK
ncbi:MAG: hypothetical protein KC931_13855, partial [Candidatus Omnitrophica bacterium]|nr:hypothetical protein [Candidatus Omnitrophota bacterium]